MHTNPKYDQSPVQETLHRETPHWSALTQWVYEEIQPFIKGRIIELGSGFGNFTICFWAAGHWLRISDPVRERCILLKEKYEHHPGLVSIYQIDPENPQFELQHSRYLKKFDTVILLNRISSIPSNPSSINNIKKLLADRGHLLLLLPVRIALFNETVESINILKHENRLYINSLLGREFDHYKTSFFKISNNATVEAAKDSKLSESPIPEFMSFDDPYYPPFGLYMVAALGKKYDRPKHVI